MIRTGSILKEGREKKQMSIPEVSLATKINPRILQAIEAGSVKDLPSHSYLRGFVRSYASYLRMDVNQVLSTFNDEMGEVQPSKLSNMPPPEMRGFSAASQNAAATEATTTAKLPDGAIAETKEVKPVEVKPVVVEQPKVEKPKPTKPEPKATPAPAPSEMKSPWASSEPKKFTSKSMLAGAAVVLICMIAIVQKLVDKYQRESELPPPQEIAKIEEVTEIKTETKPVEVKVAEEKAAEVKAPEVKATEPAKVETKPAEVAKAEPVKPVEPPAKPVEAVKPPPPPPPAPVVAAPTPPPAPKVEPVKVEPPKPPVEAAKPAETAAATPTPPPAAASQVILIEALDNVSLSFKIDNGETRKISLSPEEVHTIRAKTIVTMDISDGGAVNIVQNGKDRGVPGDLGKPIKVKFP